MSVTDKKPWEKYSPEIAESDDLKPWEKYVPSEEKKKSVQNDLTSGTQTSKRGFEPFQTPVDTKTPSVLTPKGKTEYQEQVKDYVPPKAVQQTKEEKPDFFESVKNSLSNIGTGVQQFIPNTAIALSETLQGLLGKDLGSDFYRNIVGSANNPELDRQEAYAKLAELEPQFKRTRGLIESAENFDAVGLAAATIDAMSSLVRTAITSVPTAGVGLASDMVGGSIASYNQEKAKSKGISVDELYKRGENEFAIPATIGAIGTGLEAIGLKGTIGLINKKLTGSFAKKFATTFIDVNKEGLTEFLQTGLDASNKALSQGKSVADASKVAVDEMFSKKGLESYLMGAVGSAGAAGLGRVAKGMLPTNKKKATEATQKIAEMESELSNPNISPATQEFIAENIRQNVAEVADAIENDANEVEGLSDDQKFTINSVNEIINSYEEVLSDPNASEQTKKLAQERISGLDLEVDNILEGKKLSPETQALVESKVPPLEKPTIDTEEQIIAEGQQAEADFKATDDLVTYEQKMQELDDRANQLIPEPTQEAEVTPKESREVEEVNFAKSEIEKGAITWDGDRFSPRPDLGIEWTDIRKGQKDILAGKDTVPARRLIKAINKAKEEGGYTFIQGSGGIVNKMFVPISEAYETALTSNDIAEITANEAQLAKEYDEWFNSLSEEEKNQELNFTEDENIITSGESKENVSNQKDAKPKAGNRLFNEPIKKVGEIADRYFQRVFGSKRPKFLGTTVLDKERSKRISDAFIAMKHDPQNPKVKEAYEALLKETIEQYKDFLDAGYSVEINNEEPYSNSQEMINDLRDNNKIKVLSTESGFGSNKITDKQRKDNPLLRDSGLKDINGKTLLVNDIFRAIHDFYGHAELGNSFGAKGEENAWNVHARMFSPIARRAMTTETRGQNSYVNFSGINEKIEKLREQARKLREEGNEAEAQKIVEQIFKEGSFADQKIGLLPKEFSEIDESEPKESKGVQKEEVNKKAKTEEVKRPIETPRVAERKGESTKLQTAKEEFAKVAERLRALKIDTKGKSFDATLGLPVAVWNGAVETVASAVEAGVALADAIKRGLNYIQKNHRGQFNEKEFNDIIIKAFSEKNIDKNTVGKVDESGKKFILYHSSTNVISGEYRVRGKNNSFGIFFSPKTNYSQVFGDITNKVKIEPKKTLVLQDKEAVKTGFFNMNESQYNDYLKEGFDSIAWYRKGELTEFIVIEPSIIKDSEIVYGRAQNKTYKYNEANLLDRIPILRDALSQAKDNLKQAKAKLDSLNNRLGISSDPEQKAKALFEYHKALVNYAIEYIKDVANDIAKFAKEVGLDVSEVKDAWKEANGGKELKLDDFITVEPIKTSEDFTELAYKNIESDEFRNTLSNKERESGRELTPEEKRLAIQPLLDAFKLGTDIIEKAKDEFGDKYVQTLLDYIRDNEKSLGVDKVSLILISLENDLNKQMLDDPDNLTIKKQERMVQNIAIAYQRTVARALGYGKLRQIARVGYDIDRVTDEFFSTKQKEGKRKILKAIESNMDDINAEAELQEQEVDDIIIETPKVKRTAKEVKADISEVIKKMRADLVKAARGNVALSSVIPFESQIRTVTPHVIKLAKLYAELGGMKAKEIIAEIRKEIKQVAPDVTEQDIRAILKGEQDGKVNPKDRLEKAKERVKERIAELQQQITDKRKELKIRNIPETDTELTSLIAQEKQLKEESNKYLTQESIDRINESKEKSIVTRLENELADLDDQIAKGEKERVEKKEAKSTPQIEALRAQRKAKIEILNELDPNPKEFTKQALIDAGYSRDINVTLKDGTKEKRQVLDWKKLAGEEGSIDNIREVVENALKDKGFTDAQISRMRDAFVTEFNELRANIATKAIKELRRLNEPKEAPQRKSSARRLAELYDLGLFEQNSDEFDYLVNKAIGLSDVGQEAFFEAKRFAASLSELYKMSSNEFFTKQFIREINFKISKLLNKVAFQEGGTGFKFVTIVSELMNLMLRTKLQSLKQYLDNQISGRQERLIQDVGNLLYKDISTKELDDLRKKYASVVKEDIVKNAGLYFGEVNTPFLTKSQIEDYLNSLTKDRLYHHLLSVALGKSYLEGADSLNKAASTERFFTSMVLKAMTDSSNPNRVTREEALKILNEQLTGQKFSEALNESERIIKQINQSAGREILSETKENIFRGAMDLVKANLLVGQALDAKMIEASYNAAYKVAGYGLGHEANNLISEGVNRQQAFIEEKLKAAIKNKEWGDATGLTMIATINRNIINPFVGGGMNWLFLGLQKSGIDVASPLYYTIRKLRSGIDLSTPEGVNELQKQLVADYRLKTLSRRFLIGATAASLFTLGFIASGGEDELDKWLEKNKWAKKYLSVFIPQLTLLVMASRKGEFGDWVTETFSKSAKFEKLPKIVKGIEEYNKDSDPSRAKAFGVFGNVLGSSIDVPLAPVRFLRDLGGVYKYIVDKPQERQDFLNIGFANGFFNYGAIDYMGFRPDRTYMRNIEEYIPKSDEKTIKFLRSKGLDINADSDQPIIYKGFSTYMSEEQAQKYDKKYGETVYGILKDKSESISDLSENDFKKVMKFIKNKAKDEALKTIGAVDNRASELTREGIKYILPPDLLKKRTDYIETYIRKNKSSIRSLARETAKYDKVDLDIAIMIEEQALRDEANTDSGDIIYEKYKDKLMVKE